MTDENIVRAAVYLLRSGHKNPSAMNVGKVLDAAFGKSIRKTVLCALIKQVCAESGNRSGTGTELSGTGREPDLSTAGTGREQTGTAPEHHAYKKTVDSKTGSSSSLRSEPEEKPAKKTTTLQAGEPPWTIEVRASVASLNTRTLVSLSPDDRYVLARFHALEFGGCTKSEATNRSRAQPIATGLHDLADRLSRPKRFEVNGKAEFRAILADVTVSEYIAYGRRIVTRSSRLWYRPIDVIAEIEIEEPDEAVSYR